MMNWVGGARSRVKQSQEKKIQKEFFARQRLAKKVNIHKQQSPKGHRKPVSLDLLSLQTINQTYQGENGLRKQPVKVVLGDRSNLLPRRQEDLELPMSPIRNPSNLAFLDSKTEMDTQPRHVPHHPQSHQKQLGTSSTSSVLVSDSSRRKLSRHSIANEPLPTSSRAVDNDDSLLSESFLSFRNSQEHQLSSLIHQKAIKQCTQVMMREDLKHDQCLPLHKKDLLAFQRAEKEKCLSLVEKHHPHQATACIAKPVVTSNNKRANQMIDDENPTTVSMPLKPAEACMTHSSEKSTIKLNATNDDLSDAERKTLLGLDYDKEQDPYDTIGDAVPAKKAKISSFEEMISKYERPATSKKNSKSVTSKNNNYAWWKFVTHEKSSPNDDTCKVPDVVLMEPPATDRKAPLFFKQKLPKKSIASMKRPPTVLQELLCLDEDLNNSDLFQTQDFTFENAIAVDFEEPLKQFQHYTTNLKGISKTTNDENPVNNHDAILPCEEVKIPDQQDHDDFEEQSPKGIPSTTISSISVGIQCSKTVCSMETQTEQKPVLKHSSTQCDTVQMMDTAVQADITNTSSSVMTQTSEPVDDKCLGDHTPTSHSDDLAVAQSTIIWQSLMIKILQIDASTPFHT